MKLASKGILVFICLFGSAALSAQKTKKVGIKTINVQATVIGLLEYTNDMAVLQVQAVDTTKSPSLRVNTEFLCTFKFSTKGFADPKLPSLKEGDVIKVEIYEKENTRSSQYDYQAFRYWVLPTKTISVPANPKSQK